MPGTSMNAGYQPYLGTQVEIAQQYGGLGTCQNEDDENQEEEAEHVVHLVGPAMFTLYFINIDKYFIFQSHKITIDKFDPTPPQKKM